VKPSADAPREYAIELYALVVALVFPRADAASMHALVKSGRLICTKWTFLRSARCGRVPPAENPACVHMDCNGASTSSNRH
jgi:hypothetical protein